MNIIEGDYLRDLLDQPAALQRSVEGLTVEDRLRRVAEGLGAGAFQRVILTGMGSSLHALHPLFMALNAAGHGALMLETSELVNQMPGLLGPRVLIIAVSQSGRSVEIVRLLEMTGSCTVVGITNTEDSPLAAKSHIRLWMRAGTESTVSCKTYLATLIQLEWLESALTGGDLERKRQELAQAPALAATYLADWRSHVGSLVEMLDGVRHVFVVGRGRSLAAAGTGGLILKEATHFPAEGMSSAAFRHGPFELLASHVFVLVFAGNAAASPLNRKLAADIRHAGGRAALVATDASLDVFRLPAAPESLQPLMEILPVEMLTLALPALAGTEAGKFRLASKITSIE